MPLLAAPDAPETAALLRAALASKLADIDARIAGLSQLRTELARRLGAQMQSCPLRGAHDAAA